MHCNAALDKNQTCSLLNILISCLASNFCFAQLASIRIGNNLIIQPRGNNLIVQIWKFARKLAFRSHKYCCLCQNSCFWYICLTFFQQIIDHLIQGWPYHSTLLGRWVQFDWHSPADGSPSHQNVHIAF